MEPHYLPYVLGDRDFVVVKTGVSVKQSFVAGWGGRRGRGRGVGRGRGG